ncbi:MAG: hypothetical protein NVV68_06245 [Dokdonella sp.]|nr:hypothetical protein [Dokdonella sp.]
MAEQEQRFGMANLAARGDALQRELLFERALIDQTELADRRRRAGSRRGDLRARGGSAAPSAARPDSISSTKRAISAACSRRSRPSVSTIALRSSLLRAASPFCSA